MKHILTHSPETSFLRVPASLHFPWDILVAIWKAGRPYYLAYSGIATLYRRQPIRWSEERI